MATPLIQLDGLTHAYGCLVALDGVTGDIPAGSIGLVGANGAGKSTLMKVLLGILKPTAGTASVLGLSVTGDTIRMRERVGYMPERGGLPPDQTAADFMIYAAELAGIPPKAARQRASDVLTLVGLHEERFRYLGDFSTGMLQRALLASATAIRLRTVACRAAERYRIIRNVLEAPERCFRHLFASHHEDHVI